MYDDAVNRIPQSEDDLWSLLREHFDHVRHVLWELHVETEEEALGIGQTPEALEARKQNSLSVVRFRGTGIELDQRGHFLALGRELLPYIDQALDERKLTPEFVQQWGKVMFCHGYIASYVLDDTDDFAAKRGGFQTGRARSKQPQRHWIARVLVPLVDSGMTRRAAEDRVSAYLRDLVEGEAYPARFGAEWFTPIITHGELAATYDEKHFSLVAMRALLTQPAGNIPPVPNLLP